MTNAFQSKRLIYRAVENNEDDKRFLSTQIVNDPVNMALSDLGAIRPRGSKYTETMIDGMLKSSLAAMVCLTEQEPIGFVVLGWGGTPPGQVHHRSTSIGISLAEPYQNQGYGGEAINWALDWAFRFGGYHRVSIGTVSYNERAQHLYRKLGFVEEGRSRESHWHDREWHDRIDYGMLEGEWAALRAAK